jgi:6-phosphogluconolactonase (cycloisomerase 2 family)
LPLAGQPTQVFAFRGSGPVRTRQAGAHAHFILPAPSGDHLLLTDLGSDAVRRLRVDRAGRRLTDEGIAVAMPVGSGPRHGVYSADRHHLYVVGELDGALHTIELTTDVTRGQVVASGPVVPPSSTPSDLSHITRDGDRLLIGVRGADVLAEHHLAADGVPSLTATHPLPGSWPRHHAVIGRWTVVALQRAGLVAVLDHTGATVSQAEIPSPSCILPAASPPNPPTA